MEYTTALLQGSDDLHTHEKTYVDVNSVRHTKLESRMRYWGIKVDDALEVSEKTEI